MSTILKIEQLIYRFKSQWFQHDDLVITLSYADYADIMSTIHVGRESLWQLDKFMWYDIEIGRYTSVWIKIINN